jgi:hypothetical protein
MNWAVGGERQGGSGKSELRRRGIKARSAAAPSAGRPHGPAIGFLLLYDLTVTRQFEDKVLYTVRRIAAPRPAHGAAPSPVRSNGVFIAFLV